MTRIDAVVGIDTRGYIIGAPGAFELTAGFTPVRKKGKLPDAQPLKLIASNMGEQKWMSRLAAEKKATR